MNNFTKIVITILIGIGLIGFVLFSFYKNENYGNYINIIGLFLFINCSFGLIIIFTKVEKERQDKNLRELGLKT